jgi:GNAT superfamily N-acetyltransferase
MSELRYEPVRPDGSTVLADWRHIHNVIIPTAPLSVVEIQERCQRNRLTVAYLDDVAVGCSTVRPPAGDPAAVTVIVRVRPEHRRHGLGQQLYDQAVATATALGARLLDTVVLASNEDGLRFAKRHGYVEIGRYVPDGHTIAFVDLRAHAVQLDAGRPPSAEAAQHG